MISLSRDKKHLGASVVHLVFTMCCGYLVLFDKTANGFLRGQPCVRSLDGATGICQPLSECPAIRGDATRKSIRQVDLCDSSGGMPIVCCVPTNLNSGQDAITLSHFSAQNDLSDIPSVSQRKCKEYADLVYEKHISDTNGDISKENHCTMPSSLTSGRALLGEFPHMAHLTVVPNTIKDGGVTYCGGTLISERYVLTSASYSRAYEPHRVTIFALLGELVMNNDKDGAVPETITVVQAIAHPDFEHPRKYFDIALLLLAKAPRLGWRLRPVCLPTGNQTEQTFVGTGWGKPYYNAKRFSDPLMKVILIEAPYDECNTGLRSKVVELGIHAPSQICAGHPFLRTRLCVGDGGGPLHIHSPNHYCMHEIVGINSFGVAQCAVALEAYTRVSYFVSWIESIVWPT